MNSCIFFIAILFDILLLQPYVLNYAQFFIHHFIWTKRETIVRYESYLYKYRCNQKMQQKREYKYNQKQTDIINEHNGYL